MSQAAAELAQRALARAGADALVQVTRERSLLLRFAASRPTQATAVDDVTVEVAVLHDGHVGRAATNRSRRRRPRRLRRASRAAPPQAAAAAAGTGAYPGFPVPRPGRAHDGHDPATAALDPARGGAALAAAFEAARPAALEAHGVWTAGEVETAVAGAGEVVADRVTDAFMKVDLHRPAQRAQRLRGAAAPCAAAALDPAALAAQAAAKAVARAASRRRSSPASYPVVLEAARARHAARTSSGRSPSTGSRTPRTAARSPAGSARAWPPPAINLSDSPRFATHAAARDRRRGRAQGAAAADPGRRRAPRRARHAQRGARGRASRPATRSRPAARPTGPAPTNLVLAGGGAADEQELCAPIERGIYVTRLWYANVVRPKETLVTAVTRDGTFLIEDGRISRPLADLRMTDERPRRSQPRAGADGSRSSSSPRASSTAAASPTGSVCPAVRIGALRFTGQAG